MLLGVLIYTFILFLLIIDSDIVYLLDMQYFPYLGDQSISRTSTS
jgi:hypothetical protein